MTGTSGRQRFSANCFEHLYVHIPPVSTQFLVSRILGSLDDKIELNSKINQTLEQMAQALFKSWFVDFDPVRAKMEGRDTGLPQHIADLFPDRLVDSELGKIPEGWEIETLGRINLESESGKRPKGGIDKKLNSGIPSVGAESIDSIGKFDYSKSKFVAKKFAQTLAKGWAKHFDVALYKDGARWSNPHQSDPCVALFGDGFPFEKFIVNEHIYLLRCDRLGQIFLYQLLSTHRVLNQLSTSATAKVAQPGLSQADVKNSEFILPPKILCEVYEKISKPWVGKQLQLGRSIYVLTRLRDLILPKLISGELDALREHR